MINPVLAIENWLRVLKPGGLLYLIVPDKRTTFDKKRLRTSLEHMILDYQRPCKKRDFEHYLDYSINVHGLQGTEALKDAEKLFVEDYSIHFHVFIPSDIKALLEWISEEVTPLKISEGPSMAPGDDEYHFLIEKTLT